MQEDITQATVSVAEPTADGSIPSPACLAATDSPVDVPETLATSSDQQTALTAEDAEQILSAFSTAEVSPAPDVTVELQEVPLPAQEEAASHISPVALTLGFLLLALLAAAVALLMKRRQTAPRTQDVHVADEATGKEQDMNQSDSAQPALYQTGYAQTVGTRPNQEDCYGVSTLDASVQQYGLLGVVADGIGGMEDGQVASRTVVHSMFDLLGRLSPDIPAADRLLRLAANAQNSVLAINRQAASRCGSTLVAILIKEDELSFLSVGDSRIYLMRSGALLQLNREHEVGPGHDENLALGYTNEELGAKRRGALTSYIGKENLAKIDRNTQPLRLLPDDRILLMSDGVFGTLSDSELTACLTGSARQAAEQVISAVSAKGLRHQDNATIVVIDYQ